MTRETKRPVNEHYEEMKKDLSDKYDELYQKAAKTAEKTLTWSVEKTRQLSFYIFKFILRAAIFVSILVLYLTHRRVLIDFMNRPFFSGFTPFHVIWILFMLIMISHLIPNNRLSMAWRKARGNVYEPVENYSRLNLLEHVQKMNLGAWKVMLAWLVFNAVFATLYLTGVIEAGDLMMLTIFFFLSDYICILFYCPFQSLIMKNKCCINCRIYDWGHFMMFTPMLFIKNFFSWSLFFTSCVVLIHWEIQYARHPERFWEGSNKTLQCTHCKERTCQIKRKLAKKNAPAGNGYYL